MKLCKGCRELHRRVRQAARDAGRIASKSVRSGQTLSRPLADKRRAVCAQCDALNPSSGMCADCGCYIKVKSLLVEAECPRGKWPGRQNG